eukprot:CAMPEP_0176017302 /NCGR_PEP_ID=MMETSP0120_2-20121206/8295_1 /TAXON_ID=160619 /ORGANISM="Kryptoperidinium foliaceum, Strain CCMP 1326" /LENGTH=59 /DNA_ID=CAMNT_0017350323 /DNA_START=492 /DNA_END=671 /DNA_ORIENTATION=-
MVGVVWHMDGWKDGRAEMEGAADGVGVGAGVGPADGASDGILAVDGSFVDALVGARRRG